MTEGYIQVTGGRVFYKKIGDGSGVPLLILHGGPGSTHHTYKPLELLGEERPVIFYDQLGSGGSDRPDDLSLWTLDRFIDELSEIRQALGLEQVHLLGHSWGTMLAASYMLTKPKGVKSVIFSSPCLSALQWAEDQKANLKTLPVETQEVIMRCEKEGTTDSKEYREAVKAFNNQFVCRKEEIPKEWKAPKGAFNPVIYETMWGTSEFNPTGSLKEYDVTPRLSELHLPVLFTCGYYDEATPKTTKGYADLVEEAQFHVFKESAHMPYMEEPEEYRQVIRQFLKSVETDGIR
ncbi:proline iminopeptidase-family hydrolase [Pullulanibacillus sp. KACC 23026]|uniref:proline iminopeptidase-family hydrolase n=1 Tax=Pullulanibacillus sp. KACC 23026 TaxID=3028315 RepID=UPI0023AF637F|nr:proline iminopeptidase-family hydrolase [Pullulanibacillus sp. KACC 23026]WEG12306.1 proline iminopeptidase-family hydrolase [Pullulanibacillus sp. KACC 23026]